MHKILRSYKQVQTWCHEQKEQKRFIFQHKKIWHNKRPIVMCLCRWWRGSIFEPKRNVYNERPYTYVCCLEGVILFYLKEGILFAVRKIHVIRNSTAIDCSRYCLSLGWGEARSCSGYQMMWYVYARANHTHCYCCWVRWMHRCCCCCCMLQGFSTQLLTWLSLCHSIKRGFGQQQQQPVNL